MSVEFFAGTGICATPLRMRAKSNASGISGKEGWYKWRRPGSGEEVGSIAPAAQEQPAGQIFQ